MHSIERIILVSIIVLLAIALITGKDIRPIMFYKEKSIEQKKKPVPIIYNSNPIVYITTGVKQTNE
jgi:flagellar basal body-associated protein FliL